MIKSPWAKFSIFAIPYTMVYPRAMIAYILPRLKPFTSDVKKLIMSFSVL